VLDPGKPEQVLIKRLQEIRTAVVKMAGLTESSFTRMYPAKIYRHGQNEHSVKDAFDMSRLGANAPVQMKSCVPDNHHSPMKPSQYVSGRLIPILYYYQSRVPRKYFEWKSTTFLLLVSTGVSPCCHI
jgi:hypothetical protein